MKNDAKTNIIIFLIIITLINITNTQPPTQRANQFISPINTPMAADTLTTSPLAAPLEQGKNTPLVNPPKSPPPKPPKPPKLNKLPKVKLDRPRLGSTTISGRGPVGLPIKIYEVANTADLLCTTTINRSGQFTCTTTRPLRRTERVAVTAPNAPYTRHQMRQIRLVDIPTYGYILAERKVR